MPLILPESAEIAAWKAEQALQVEAKTQEIEHWDRELKRIDPGLSLVVAKPGSEDTGLLPNRWHICKYVPDGPDEYWPLVGPDDSYREPGGWMLDELKASDLWDPRVFRDKKEARRKLHEAKVRAKELLREQAQDEYKASLTAMGRLRGDSQLRTTQEPKRQGQGLRKPDNGPQEP